MKDPKVIMITIQHAPIGDGKDWVMDVCMERCKELEKQSWHSESIEAVIGGIPDVLFRAMGESKQVVAHHD